VLSYVEPLPTFDTLKLNNTTNDKPEFPSDEFGEFMELVVKWNLSDACASDILQFSRKICDEDTILPSSIKQGRQLLDKMVVPHLTFQKTIIMTHQDEEYYLYHRPIFDAIKELLENRDIFKYCVFDYTPLDYEGERIYGEQFNSEW
jgi:hypothetical protein